MIACLCLGIVESLIVAVGAAAVGVWRWVRRRQ